MFKSVLQNSPKKKDLHGVLNQTTKGEGEGVVEANKARFNKTILKTCVKQQSAESAKKKHQTNKN